MNKRMDHITALMSALRMPLVDFEVLYRDKNILEEYREEKLEEGRQRRTRRAA